MLVGKEFFVLFKRYRKYLIFVSLFVCISVLFIPTLPKVYEYNCLLFLSQLKGHSETDVYNSSEVDEQLFYKVLTYLKTKEVVTDYFKFLTKSNNLSINNENTRIEFKQVENRILGIISHKIFTKERISKQNLDIYIKDGLGMKINHFIKKNYSHNTKVIIFGVDSVLIERKILKSLSFIVLSGVFSILLCFIHCTFKENKKHKLLS